VTAVHPGLLSRSSIDAIYKQLTRSPVHPLGGTAYLALEVDDEPYLGGVKYTAMPPTKRFRDMEQLSGGRSGWREQYVIRGEV